MSEQETEPEEVQQDDGDDAGTQGGGDDAQGDEPDAPEHGSGGGAV